MYPLGIAQPDNPTPEEQSFYFLLREDLCRGHNTERSVKISEWIRGQGIEEYDAMGNQFKELMLHPFWNGEDLLTPEQIDMYYMACYDLDRFRRFLFQSSFLQLFEVDEGLEEDEVHPGIGQDDRLLAEDLVDLRAGPHHWVNGMLLGRQ